MSMFSGEDIAALTSDDKLTSSYAIVKDHCFDDILELIYQESCSLKEHLRPAQMSRGEQVWADEYFRGDSLCWLTPQLCKDLNLIGIQQYIKRIMSSCSIFSGEDSLGILNEGYNVQFALYPGKGEGYNRHRDAFRNVTGEPSRQLTCLLYLNKHWEPDDGGQLRIFTYPGLAVRGAGEPFSFWGIHGTDVDPLYGRFVAFRSELVEHAVLPCFAERMAITFWANGSGRRQSLPNVSTSGEGIVAPQTSEFVFSFTEQTIDENADSDSFTASDTDDCTR